MVWVKLSSFCKGVCKKKVAKHQGKKQGNKTGHCRQPRSVGTQLSVAVRRGSKKARAPQQSKKAKRNGGAPQRRQKAVQEFHLARALSRVIQ